MGSSHTIFEDQKVEEELRICRFKIVVFLFSLILVLNAQIEDMKWKNGTFFVKWH